MNQSITMDKAKSVVFLTAALVMVATWAVGATGWTKGINIITFVGLGAVLIGMMLARSILPAFVAHIFSLIIGIAWAFWVTARLLPPHYTWIERWENMAMRLTSWYQTAIQGGTSYDNLMFVFQMSIIVWGMGYLTMWLVFRSGKPWSAIVPGGVVLLINLYYAPQDITFWFLMYMLVSLLLIVRYNLYSQELKWRSGGVFFRPDISFDFLRDGFIFSVLVIAFAWLTPPVVDAKTIGLLDEFQGSWRDMQNDWNRLFADLNYRSQRSFDSFGSSLTLGGPRRLTNEPVMDVRVEGIGRYWRAVVYDYYTGDGWLTRDEDNTGFGPDVLLSIPTFAQREVVTQTYTFHRDNATVLYAMSNPVALDRTAKVSFSEVPETQVRQAAAVSWMGTEAPWVEEITYIRSNATVDKGESYQVLSLTSFAPTNMLESAGDDYPAWVTERYLQLPPSVTDRTRNLAQEITASYDNAFEKAQAIERFLRADLRYNERMESPPRGVDKIDYVLFTGKEAYCDYYASSMIVMLRSLGIPARMAAGFARGTYNSDKSAFEVLNKDAHSWVEVYFPQYGWIEFEPTSAQPVIIRATSPNDGSLSSGVIPPSSSLYEEEMMNPPGASNIPIDEELIGSAGMPFNFTVPLIGWQVSIPRAAVNGSFSVAGLVLLSVIVAGSLWWRKQSQVGHTDAILTLYPRMVKFAGWMGLSQRPWQTPYEHAVIVEHNLPAHKREVDLITNAYVVTTFSNHKNGRHPFRYTSSRYELATAWRNLRPAMLKEAARRRLPRWLRR